MPARVRHRLDRLTPYERATATLAHVGGRWGILSGRAAANVLLLFDPFQPPDELALADVLREVLPDWRLSPEETVREALRDPAHPLVLRFDPDPDGALTAAR